MTLVIVKENTTNKNSETTQLHDLAPTPAGDKEGVSSTFTAVQLLTYMKNTGPSFL